MDVFENIKNKIFAETITKKLNEFQELLKEINSSLDVTSKELSLMKSKIQLPENHCPVCLIDFVDIPEKIVMLGCGAHLLCIDCVQKMVKQECPVCKSVFVKYGIQVNTWLRDMVLSDEFSLKKKECNKLKKQQESLMKMITDTEIEYMTLTKDELTIDEIIEQLKCGIKNSPFSQQLVTGLLEKTI
jgi:hypothetical protein